MESAAAGPSTVALRANVDPDRELVDRAVRGDLDAFEQLVDRHRDVVFRVAARIVGREEADDVSQDAFLRAFHRLERFRAEGSFRAWLLRIAHNTALNHAARRVPEPVGAASEIDEELPPADAGREPVARLERRERGERLELKLRELRHEHRAVLVLRDLEGLPYEEIAQVTDAPLGSVKGRLHRARSELIEILRNNTYDWELPR
jgi:RNA polymerase sigma-70 factor (ECF subfamily)